MGYYRQGPPPGGYNFRLGTPPLTPMVRRIMIVTVGIWVLQFLLYNTISNIFLQKYFGLNLYTGILNGFVWQPFTYFWLHDPQGIWHILFNMIMLWFFGGDLEEHWGSKGFLRYYIICGVGAGLFIMLGNFIASLTAPMVIPTVGASGAIYGLLLAYGVIFAERTVLFMMIFPMKARTLAILCFVIAFFSMFDGRTGVSHIAHVGGAVVGFIYIKRLWNVRRVYGDLRWRWKRRQFKVIEKDDDRWIN